MSPHWSRKVSGERLGFHVACSGVWGGEPVEAVPTCRVGSAGNVHLAARPPRTRPASSGFGCSWQADGGGTVPKPESPSRLKLHCRAARPGPPTGPSTLHLAAAPGSKETGSQQAQEAVQALKCACARAVLVAASVVITSKRNNAHSVLSVFTTRPKAEAQDQVRSEAAF